MGDLVTVEKSAPRQKDYSHLVEMGKNRFRIHTEAYVSDDIYKAEISRIFEKSWLFVAHESELTEPGEYKTAYLGNQPVLVVRNRDGGISVLINRCVHRGAALCRDTKGKVRAFVCPYHGWRWELDGTLSEEHGPGSDFASRPAIAVLPFREVSPLAGYEHFVDAACEDLVSALSSWRSFPVISYASTLPYKGQAIDVASVGVELVSGFCVQGSLRRTREGVRVQSELTRADTRHQLWSDRWEAPLDGFWDFQD